MRNGDPHRENVENIFAICLPIMTMQHIRESSSASHAMKKSAWNASSDHVNRQTDTTKRIYPMLCGQYQYSMGTTRIIYWVFSSHYLILLISGFPFVVLWTRWVSCRLYIWWIRKVLRQKIMLLNCSISRWWLVNWSTEYILLLYFSKRLIKHQCSIFMQLFFCIGSLEICHLVSRCFISVHHFWSHLHLCSCTVGSYASLCIHLSVHLYVTWPKFRMIHSYLRMYR